jgi:membrane protein DedA with SNARE-associated domain
VAFLEAVPVLGSLIPGSTIILSLSALIATGDLNLIGVLAAAMLGAALGDGTAFWLGHNYPKLVHGVWPLTKYPEVIRRSERFFRERGSAAVFLARFVPPVRAFIPIIAGGLGMPPRRFFFFNLLAIALWAPMHVVPGLLAGTAYKRAGVIAEHLLLPVLAGLLAIGFLVWAFRRMRTAP